MRSILALARIRGVGYRTYPVTVDGDTWTATASWRERILQAEGPLRGDVGHPARVLERECRPRGWPYTVGDGR